jgi:hypothetical protein
MGCGSRAFGALMRRNLLYRRRYWLATVRHLRTIQLLFVHSHGVYAVYQHMLHDSLNGGSILLLHTDIGDHIAAIICLVLSVD